MQYHITTRFGPARIGSFSHDTHSFHTPHLIESIAAFQQKTDEQTLLLTHQKDSDNPLLTHHTITHSSSKHILFSHSSISLPPPHLNETDETQQSKHCLLVPSHPDCITDLKEKLNEDIHLIIPTYLKALYSQQSNFLEFIVALKAAIGPERLLYAPAVATPENLSLLTYLGFDVFDTTTCLLAATQHLYFTDHGIISQEKLNSSECHCPICSSIPPQKQNQDQLLKHNHHMLYKHLNITKNAIANHSLRNLVEQQIRSSPHLCSMLRIADSEYSNYLEESTPLDSNAPLLATTQDSLNRPSIKRYHKRLLDRYKKPPSASVLLILPCSAKKPYSSSRSHSKIRYHLQNVPNKTLIHELIITSPLGLVPRELERLYPASNYDISVTGHWHQEEKTMIQNLLKNYLENNSYEHIIVHLPKQTEEIITEILPNCITTCKDSPTSQASLEHLKTILTDLLGDKKSPKPAQRRIEEITNLASMQFGPILGEKLTKNTKIIGKYPINKIMDGNTQLAMNTPQRAYLSLTIQGAQRLYPTEEYTVTIHDDITLKGSVFAPGIITADPQIRIGDDVLIRNSTQLIGCGVAQMSGYEMTYCTKGEAVKTRHKA